MAECFMPVEFMDVLRPLLPPDMPVGPKGGRPPVRNGVVLPVIWYVGTFDASPRRSHYMAARHPVTFHAQTAPVNNIVFIVDESVQFLNYRKRLGSLPKLRIPSQQHADAIVIPSLPLRRILELTAQSRIRFDDTALARLYIENYHVLRHHRYR